MTTATAKTATCKCGAIFELPAGRGRPPVSCLPCRMLKAGPVSHTTDVVPTVKALCVKCGTAFDRPVKRGRPHTACLGCRVIVAEVSTETEATTPEDAESVVVVDGTIYTFTVGDFVRLKAGVSANDLDGRDAFVIKAIKYDADGSIKWYDAFGGDPTDPEGVRMFRCFAPEKIRPENRKHVSKHRHHPGNKGE